MKNNISINFILKAFKFESAYYFWILKRLSGAFAPLVDISSSTIPFPFSSYPIRVDKSDGIDTFPANISINDHISRCLRSNNINLIQWGLSNFIKSSINDKKCLQNLQFIISLMKNVSLENMVAKCLIDLSKNFGKIVAAPLLSPIMNKINENPAIEYVQILSSLLQFLTPETIECCILPMLERFVSNKIISYHYAAGELIVSTSFETLHITTDLFLKFLNSCVIVNNYLTKMIKSASKTFSKEWIGKILPAHLLCLANDKPDLRCGILKTVFSLSDIIFKKYFYNYITSALTWATTLEDSNIELILASKADEILTPKTIDLYPQMKDILEKILRSKDKIIRVHLPKIITSNPSAFFGFNLNLGDVFISLVNDISYEIRLAILDSFCFIYRIATSWSQMNRESLISLFIQFFKDPSPVIKERMCTSVVYSTLGSDRICSIMPYFIEFASTIDKWRNFSELIKTFISWSNKVICTFWTQLAPIVNIAAEKWPHALAPSIQSFYVKVSIFVNDEIENKLEEMIISNYAKSPNYRMRELFPKIAGGLCFKTQRLSLVQFMWNRIKDNELNDIVVSVRGKSIQQLIKFRLFFFENEQKSLENEVISKFIEIRKLYNCDDIDTNKHFKTNQLCIPKLQDDNKDQTEKSSNPISDEIENSTSQNLENVTDQNSEEIENSSPQNIEKLLAEKQYMKDILQENWIVFRKEMMSPSYDYNSIKHSKSLESNLAKSGQVNDSIKTSSAHSIFGLHYQKIKPVKIVHKSQTNSKLMYRKSLGDSKLPPILFHH